MADKKPLILKKKTSSYPDKSKKGNWRILIVDDEKEVHNITTLILGDLSFKGKGIEFLHAYSAEEAEQLLSREEDIAIILLDVVMETDHAGLELTKTIRKKFHNDTVRIILRTGQPGQAPEERVILDYDINDYKAKNELTARKLVTTVIASLRAYEGLVKLKKNRRGLERIINSTDTLFKIDTLMDFSSGVLTQLSAFIECQPNGIMCMKLADGNDKMQGFPCEGLKILGASGEYAECNDCSGELNCKQVQMVDLAKKALAEQKNIYHEDYAILYLDAKGVEGSIALLHGVNEINEEDQLLLSMFTKKISLALANAVHYGEMISAKEVATTDYLTGLANRRHLIDVANVLLSSQNRANAPTAVAMLDLDHFKQINDSYGHNTGDKVLQAVADFLKGNTRGSDVVARIGGEEFCLITTNIQPDHIEQYYNQIREGISQLEVDVDGEKLRITSSIGITTESGDLDQLLKKADAKLYQAKNSGRNCIVY